MYFSMAKFIAIDLTFSVITRVVGVAAVAPDVPTAFIVIIFARIV
jgi:hypothetical protein